MGTLRLTAVTVVIQQSQGRTEEEEKSEPKATWAVKFVHFLSYCYCHVFPGVSCERGEAHLFIVSGVAPGSRGETICHVKSLQFLDINEKIKDTMAPEERKQTTVSSIVGSGGLWQDFMTTTALREQNWLFCKAMTPSPEDETLMWKVDNHHHLGNL